MMHGRRIKSLKKEEYNKKGQKTDTPRLVYTLGSLTKRKRDLDALDGHGTLAVELIGITAVTLLLAVLEALALVVLKHAVLTAVMAGAEAAVADNGLSTVFAVLEGAANLLGGHAAAKGQGEVQG